MVKSMDLSNILYTFMQTLLNSRMLILHSKDISYYNTHTDTVSLRRLPLLLLLRRHHRLYRFLIQLEVLRSPRWISLSCLVLFLSRFELCLCSLSAPLLSGESGDIVSSRGDFGFLCTGLVFVETDSFSMCVETLISFDSSLIGLVDCSCDIGTTFRISTGPFVSPLIPMDNLQPIIV